VLGLDTVQHQVMTLSIALAGSVASLFLLGSLGARTLVGEVEAVRDAVRHVVGGGERPELPELTPPLEELKIEVLGLAQEFQAQQGRLQEKLDTARQQIFFLTNHDPLTGLRTARRSRSASRACSRAPRRRAARTRCCISTSISSTASTTSFGHLAGDELLRRITPILQSSLREGETLARIGGDEFAVLLENCSADSPTRRRPSCATRCRRGSSSGATRPSRSGSAWAWSRSPSCTPSLSAVMSEADTACFTAKEQGRNRVFAFHDTTTSQYMRQTSRGWLKRINDAMAEGAFTLLYQPIVPIDGPRNVGTPRVEACCA
jgi:diguanylate cyclase (GGDEF)-like protein